MNYNESEKTLNTIKRKYGEAIFRCGISHLMDIGIRNLTSEKAEETINQIQKQDDSRAIMSNDFMSEIVKCASEIAVINHIHVLVYIKNNMEFDV